MVIKSKVSSLEKKVLLVDIGGTNVRTATAEIGSFELQNANKQNLDCLDSFDEIIENLLNQDTDIKHIVFSIAGPKLHQSIAMTNREFKIGELDILNKFEIDSCHILNDWESIGHGLSLFDRNEMIFINEGNSFNETALVLGPGTGLGVAQVINNNIVLPTEIGNSLLSIPKLFKELNLSNLEDFIVIEDLLSGGGLKKIYKNISSKEQSPEEIVATYSKNEFSQKSVQMFLKSLSQILSELALAYMPGRGIYIAGGLMRSLHQFLDTDRFMKEFLENRKSTHADVLAQIPLAIINQEMTCLHGSLNFINKFSVNLK